MRVVEVDNTRTLLCPCGGSPFVYQIPRCPDPSYRARCSSCGDTSSRMGNTPEQALTGWDWDTESELLSRGLPLLRKQAPIPPNVKLENQIIKVQDQVTNAQFQRFRPDHEFGPGKENKPVTNITFVEGMAYAKWLSQTTGYPLRLITETERALAEATFEADFSQIPSSEIPNVGTFGKNADGVTGLIGVTYDWCASDEDLSDFVALGWEPGLGEDKFTMPSTLEGLRELQEDLNRRIQKAESAVQRKLLNAESYRIQRGSCWFEGRTKANRGGEIVTHRDLWTGIRLVEVIGWR